jgi:hypothetical protein
VALNLTLHEASISAPKFEAFKKGKNQKGGDVGVAVNGGNIMELFIETKVAIAVATGFVVLVVGAMAQG